MPPDFPNFSPAIAGEPRCQTSNQFPWYMSVLEAIRTETIDAITTYPHLKIDSLEMIFWRHTTNCLRSGNDNCKYIFTLTSNPTFEIHLTVDENLRLSSAQAESEALSEADPILIDVTKYVAVFYQEFLIHLVRRLNDVVLLST
ncbi:MAG: hypothetical protein ABF335_02815 [Alphaproteobacteria bacterium]